MKKHRQVFLKAAGLIASQKEKFACLAILFAAEKYLLECEEVLIFSDYFNPHNGNLSWWHSENTEDDRNARLIALLLMAEICEASV
jgi:hypothetical protein